VIIMASVFDVAEYVLSKLGKTPTMKLQKLVYYCQAWSLAWDGLPLFDDEFEAWANGPVNPKLFAAHKGVFSVEPGHFEAFTIPDIVFTEKNIETMDIVIRDYGDKEPWWLSELTHMEAPWRAARCGVRMGEPSKNLISKESMQSYYEGLISGEAHEVRTAD